MDFNKLEFLKVLGSIRQKALKPSTILSAFKETGLIPYRPGKVVDKLREKEKEKEVSGTFTIKLFFQLMQSTI